MSSQSFAEGRADPGRRLRVAILGSTGSIGRQAVEVMAAHPDRFEVVALAGGHDTGLLAEQAALLHSPVVTTTTASTAGVDLPIGTLVESGDDVLERLAIADDVDL